MEITSYDQKITRFDYYGAREITKFDNHIYYFAAFILNITKNDQNGMKIYEINFK